MKRLIGIFVKAILYNYLKIVNFKKKMMKKILFILASFPLFSFAQYSNFYNIDHNINANINKNINVSGTVNKNVNVSGKVTTTKNINTIDYGQLALANAEREKNRLANIKYADEKERFIALEIASNPIKAYDYGRINEWEAKGKTAKKWGFKKFVFKHKKPHSSLFTRIEGYNYQNISDNNITTEIEIESPFYPEGLYKNKIMDKEVLENWLDIIEKGSESYAKDLGSWQIGTKNKTDNYLLKKDVNKTKVYGKNGFSQSLAYENDYEYVLKDNFYAFYNGIIFRAGVRYKGDKDEVSFEDLEGRRHYFKRLMNQIISTGSLYDYK